MKEGGYMSFWFDWLGKIIILIFIILIVDSLLPQGETKKYVKFSVSLIFLLLILEPVFGLFSLDPERLLRERWWDVNQTVIEETGEDIEFQKQALKKGQEAYTLQQTNEKIHSMLGPVLMEEGVVLEGVEIDEEEEVLILSVDMEEGSMSEGEIAEVSSVISEVPETAIQVEREEGG